MRELMTPEPVADYLQVATETVYRLIRADRLAAMRVGRVYRIAREDLESYLLANSNRHRVRDAMLARLDAAAERSPAVDSDDLLEGSEREDEAQNGTRPP